MLSNNPQYNIGDDKKDKDQQLKDQHSRVVDIIETLGGNNIKAAMHLVRPVMC